jgi:hypothetical protein
MSERHDVPTDPRLSLAEQHQLAREAMELLQVAANATRNGEQLVLSLQAWCRARGAELSVTDHLTGALTTLDEILKTYRGNQQQVAAIEQRIRLLLNIPAGTPLVV